MALKTHMRVLDGNTDDSWLAGALKVAFASTDMKTVNQHFGFAESLVVYAVDLERSKLLEVFQFGDLKGDENTVLPGANRVDATASPAGSAPGTEQNSDSSGTNRVDATASPAGSAPGTEQNKLIEKLQALDGCLAVYAQAIGAAAVGHLKAHGIHPVKVHAGASIKDLLEVFQEELRLGPSAWLAKVIKSQTPIDPERFNEMEDEGWEE